MGKKLTLEELRKMKVAKQLAEKDNKEKGKSNKKKSHEICDKCNVGCKPCSNITTCIHFSMQ